MTKSIWDEKELMLWNPEKIARKMYGVLYTIAGLTLSASDPKFCNKICEILERYPLKNNPTIPAEPIETYEGKIAWRFGGGLMKKIKMGKLDEKVAIRVGEIVRDCLKPATELHILDLPEDCINLLSYWHFLMSMRRL